MNSAVYKTTLILPCALRREFSAATSVTDTENNVQLRSNHRYHKPVMVNEVLDMLQPQKGKVFVDMTYGAGGHTQEILKSADDVRVFALDRDPYAHSLALTMAKTYNDRLIPLLGKFSDLEHLLSENGVSHASVDGFLFDAGCSSMQFDMAGRGFALSSNGPLDMRMDGNRIPDHPTAADVVNNLDEASLAKIIKTYGEERLAKPIAQAIVEARFMFRPLRTTQELADLVASVACKDERVDKLQRPSHAATKTFQALRIFVNNELNELSYGCELAHQYLKDNGRLVALTFHSLEDRIIKRHLHGIDLDEPLSTSMSQKYRNANSWHSKEEVLEVLEKRWTPLSRKVILPTEEEVAQNPRSRSAKLRAAAKNHQVVKQTVAVVL